MISIVTTDVLGLAFIVLPSSIQTSISAIGPPVAGYNFTLICTVTLTEGLTGIPSVEWMDSGGQQINSVNDLVLSDPMTSGQMTNRTLYFDPIRTSDGGTYTCVATVPSPALAMPLNMSAVYVISVLLSKINHIKVEHYFIIFSLKLFRFL